MKMILDSEGRVVEYSCVIKKSRSDSNYNIDLAFNGQSRRIIFKLNFLKEISPTLRDTTVCKILFKEFKERGLIV
jgi:hypothetical protein